ncbi:MAG: hypothetical protein ISR72_00280 [Methylobacter sp.]|nr:hypothetical protein [Methylobacter sp.]
MSQCLECGHQRNAGDIKCPKCGRFYSKIAEIIAEQEAQEEMQTFRGRCKRIVNSGDIKSGLLDELKQMWAGLTKKGMFALFVIFVFVFALVASVL